MNSNIFVMIVMVMLMIMKIHDDYDDIWKGPSLILAVVAK
jgi:hypothetical protein